jgi:hypothetical protein
MVESRMLLSTTVMSSDDCPMPPFWMFNSPLVVDVAVVGRRWTPEFKAYLASNFPGRAGEGYSVPDRLRQFQPLPWTGLDRLIISFDRLGVVVDQSDLAIRGSASAEYPVAGFSHTLEERNAAWILAEPTAADRIVLDLNADGSAGGVHGFTEYDCLDGNWVNDGTDTYPSGNGLAGGDFVFDLNVLAGDVNQDAAVNAVDLADVKRRVGSSTTGDTGAGYSIFADVTGDGRINALDVAAVKQRLGSRLPGDTARAAASAYSAQLEPVNAPLSSATRDLFTSQPILAE